MTDTNKLDIDTIIAECVVLLKNNLEKYPPFDPSKPYEEKNLYFNEIAARVNILLVLPPLQRFAELCYERFVYEILEYEKTHNKKFNKGMVYANLGIAQMANSKFDVGIAHLLAAGEEDLPVNPNFDVLDTTLWHQFEYRKIFPFLVSFNKKSDAGLGFVVDEIFLSDLMKGMEQQDRMFLEGTIWVILDSLNQHQLTRNVYTRGRLYSGLKDLCLLTESLLRKKQIANGIIKANAQVLLNDNTRGPGLLTNALSASGIGYPQVSLAKKTGANDIQTFLNNLEEILDTSVNAELRRVYCLHLVRNFTGHHFDLSETVTTPKKKKFFELYETVFINILSAILYFKSINAI